jgi:AraC-like DNA-binding protein
MVNAAPSRGLQGAVAMYRGYSFDGLEPGSLLGLPSAFLTFIISFGDSIDIASMPGDQAPGRFDAFVGGLHLRPATVRHAGSGAGITIDVSPSASRAVFGVPAADLVGQVVDLADLLGSLGAELAQRLRDAATWQERFGVLDFMLGRLVNRDAAPAPDLYRTWHQIARSGGRATTASLARDVGYSRRQLATRFAAEFGFTTKAVSRIVRFDRASALLDRGLRLAEVATLAGYYDQSHLTNEWKKLAGVSPTAWLGDDLRDRGSAEVDLAAST